MEERGATVTLCVVDASALGPLLIDDEVEALLPGLPEAFAEGSVIAPMHWPLEATSILQNAVRRGRIDPAGRASAVAKLAALAVEIDLKTNEKLWSDTLRLVDRHSLTICDAAYLELAIRRNAALATLDGALRDAASHENVELFGR
jgi:predicted nucleic acid-binding protein